MTKIAIKGPASGTGSYTLNAPDTADTLDFELPTEGTHLASAQADGMPLGPGGDPVVESGSNSDGSWTRWADGTQLVYFNTPDALGPSGGNDQGTYYAHTNRPFPISFTSNVSAGGSKRSMGSTGFIIQAEAADLSTWKVRQTLTGSWSTGAGGYSLYAFGRWK